MPCNVSVHRGLCGCCVRSAKWIPVVFISAIVTWSYYAYVVQLVLFNVNHVWQQAIMLLLYHVCFVLFVWSYGRTIFSPLGSVPKRFRLSSEDMESIDSADDHKSVLERILVSKDLPCTMRSIQQEIRYCSECSLVKPDRTHHCSVCGACVLKMDHHCPWVNNCVAYHNYKFFILFLGYALLYCIYVALSSLKYFLEFWTNGPGSNGADKFHVLFLFFVSAMFSISLASLFGYHCYLVSKNMTTLEAFRAPVFRHGPDKMAFHLGKYNNFQEVFGDNRWLWFLPVFTSFGDGITFPQRGQLDEEAGLLGPSPPTTQFPSAESMPMLRQGLANGGVSDDDMWDSRPAQAQRQASSSTTSSSENEAARLNGGRVTVSTPLRQTQHEDTTLVTVSM